MHVALEWWAKLDRNAKKSFSKVTYWYYVCSSSKRGCGFLVLLQLPLQNSKLKV